MQQFRRFVLCFTIIFVFAMAGSSVAETDYTIKLKTGDLNPVRNKVSSTLATALEKQHGMIQFEGPLTDDVRQQLAGEGIVLLDYIPNYTYTVRFDRIPDQSTMDRYGIRWYDRIAPEQKIAPDITEVGIRESSRRGGDLVQFVVVLHPDEDQQAWGQRLIDDYRAEVVGYDPIINSIDVILPEQAFYRLSEFDAVLWIEQALPLPRELNNYARDNMDVEAVQEAPYNITGSGVTVAEWDGGRADYSHTDFGGRVTSLDNAAISTHATHVAGTVMGSGATYGDLRYRGMAPEANLLTQLWWNSSSEMVNEYNSAVNMYSADLATNSWGYGADPVSQSSCDNFLGNYYSVCTSIDNVVRGAVGEPITIVWSNGNQRSYSSDYCGSIGWTYGTVTPLPTAKNVIGVGAVNSNNSTMTSFSSWGPTDDGRIKPDVTGPGCQSNYDYGVTSCKPGSGYTSMCGTSMSAPAVAGVLALMREQWNSQIGTSNPLSSTMKGVLINTATDLGTVGPDYQFGHGNVNALKAVKKIGIGEPSYVEGQISTGENNLYDLTVPGNTPLLRVTLVWDDPGGTVSASQHLKNDLDLVLIDPFDNTEYPWVLDPDNPNYPATTGVDHTNNVVTVGVSYPSAGLWKAQVSGYNIPDGPQAYSLIFTPDSINTPGNLAAVAVYDAGDITEQPGTTFSTEFWVTNIGADYDSVQVQIGDDAGWLGATVDTVVYLDSYDSAYVTAQVTVPAPSLAGDEDLVTCTATSLTDDLVTSYRQTRVVAGAYYIVDVQTPVIEDTVTSPGTYEFSLTVYNQGNDVDIITLSPSGEADWYFTPFTMDISLAPGTDSTVSFMATVPAEVEHLSVNTVDIDATSEGGAGDQVSFTLIANNPYTPPQLVSPSDIYYTQERSPEFVWTGDGDSYTLYLASDSLLTNIVRSYGGIASTSFTIPGGEPLDDSKYFWAVRKYVGADSSSLQRFPRRLLVDNSAPLGGNPVSPADGGIVNVSQPTFTFAIESGTPPQHLAPEYSLFELSQDPAFAIGVIYEGPLSALSVVPGTPLDPGRWYWRVQRADSADNYSAYSESSTFLLDNEMPAVPTLTAPLPGASVGDDTVTFTWTTGAPPAYETSKEYFYLHISSRADFSDWATFNNFIQTDSISLPATTFDQLTTYYWRVKAYDSAGYYSAYSDANQFTYQTAMCGDMNGDTKINLADISLMIGMVYLGGDEPDPLWVASVNGDQKVNLADISKLIGYVYLDGDDLNCVPW